MKFEFSKILKNRWLLCLCFAVLLLNGILFCEYCKESNGTYSFLQMKEAYAEIEVLSSKADVLEKYVNGISNDYPDDLITDSPSAEYAMLREITERTTQCTAYLDFLQNVQAENGIKMQLGFFEEGSFSYKSLEKSTSVYHDLEGVSPVPCFSGSIEKATSYSLADIFLLLLGCSAAFFLVAVEKYSGQLLLLRPTKNGRLSLFIKKYLSIIAWLLLGAVLLYGSVLLLSVRNLGTVNLQWPVQSVFGMQACPYEITVGEYLSAFFAIKILWAIMFTTVFFALCTYLDRYTYVFVAIAVLLGASILAKSSANLWLRTIQLLSGMDTKALFGGCVYLDLVGYPVSRLIAQSGDLTITWLIASLVSAISFCQKSIVSTGTKTPLPARYIAIRNTRLCVHEIYKVLVPGCALLLIVLFVVVQIISYGSFKIRQDQYEHCYRQYSEVLSGYPTEEKEAYIAAEFDRFNVISQELSAIMENLEYNSMIPIKAQQLQAELTKETALEDAAAQYDMLQPGMQYVYKTGYERLWGNSGIRDDTINTIKLGLILSLILSFLYTVDHYYGVDILQRAVGKERQIRKVRRFMAVGVIIVCALVAYFPQYIAIGKGYGFSELSAQANSLRIFKDWNAMWTLRHVLYLRGACQLLLAGVLGIVVAIISKRKLSPMMAALISIIVTCTPFVIVLLSR